MFQAGTSVTKVKEFYEIIKKDFGRDFYPLSYEDLDNRNNTIVDLAINSNYENIIISGCGDEEKMWDVIKNKFNSL